MRQSAHLINGVEHPGGRFAMHHGDMADRRVGVEDRVDRLHVRARNFAAVVSVMGDTHKAGHLDHSCAVCTVADDQHLILRTQCAAQYGFHSIAAAALQ